MPSTNYKYGDYLDSIAKEGSDTLPIWELATPLSKVILGEQIPLMEDLLQDIDELITDERNRRSTFTDVPGIRFNQMCTTIAGRLHEAGFGDCLAMFGYYYKNRNLFARREDLFDQLHEEIKSALLVEQRKRYGHTFDELRGLAEGIDNCIDLKVVEVDRHGTLEEHEITQEDDPASFFCRISPDSRYFILVDNLSPATTDVLGACLRVPPGVFLRHISGGGFIQHQISRIGRLAEHCPNNCDHTGVLQRREVYLAVQYAQEGGYSLTWRRLSELSQEGYKQEGGALRSCRSFERSATEHIAPNFERPGNEGDRTGYTTSRVYRSHHLLDRKSVV